jgi:hypothetical protein
MTAVGELNHVAKMLQRGVANPAALLMWAQLALPR